MNIKQSQLVGLIKEVVRESLRDREYNQILNEVSPPGAKSERMIQHVKQSLRTAHPEWSEDKITGVAIATAWKHHSEVDESNTQKPSDVERIVRMLISKGIKDPEKIRQLASQLHLKMYNKSIDMETLGQVIEKEMAAPVSEDKQWIQKAVNPAHKGYCTPMSKSTCTPARKALAMRFKKGDIHKDNVDEASYKVVAKNEVDVSDEDKAREIQTDPKVNEASYKVQKRSYTTVKDAPNDPKNTRDPELPVDEAAYKVQGRSYKTFVDAPKGDTNYKDDPENT
jgi:hypothetical protein